MEKATLHAHPKSEDHYVSSVVLDLADEDLEQVTGKNYDPTPDKRDMRRLGKRQELKRRFRFFSIAGYVIVLGLTWEFSLVLGAFSLSNGGAAGAIWLTFAVCCGMSTVMLSLAEMASMAPTSGGQYHWVSEFAPRNLQKQLSFAVGWLCALGWQAAMPLVASIGTQQVLALISVSNPDYTIKGWHGALLTIAFTVVAILFNIFAIGKLPLLEGVAVTLHLLGFIAIITILWVFGPHAPAEQTFTVFVDNNHWGNIGLAVLIAMVAPVTTFIGGDSAVHLAEELKDASYSLPRAMICAAVVNYILGFTMTVTLMFNLGSVKDDLSDPSGQPWVAIVYRITGSKAATIIMIIVVIIMFFFCGVNQVTTASRQLFAFARDKGVPCHRFLSKVQRNGVPSNAIYFTLVFSCLLALIQIGSSVAFNIILSVSSTGLFTSYIVPIVCVVAKRFRGEQFPASKFTLGSWGLLINIIALCFLTLGFVFLFMPPVPNPDPASMNWGCLIYGVAVLGALIYYFAKGRREYQGPVNYVRWQTREDLAAADATAPGHMKC